LDSDSDARVRIPTKSRAFILLFSITRVLAKLDQLIRVHPSRFPISAASDQQIDGLREQLVVAVERTTLNGRSSVIACAAGRGLGRC
jgi:hypothetical protein